MRFMASIINRDKPVNRPTTRPDSEEKDDMERDSCMWRVLRGCQQTHCWLCECEVSVLGKSAVPPKRDRWCSVFKSWPIQVQPKLQPIASQEQK